ncbi:MAG TPA: hypothetical protein VFY29_01145 [Terriglobia bacterium]|nr:hypothetical protein [Terriglobia bacterium]
MDTRGGRGGIRPAGGRGAGSQVIVVPSYGYGGGGVWDPFYGPVFGTGFDTGYYPLGVWPSPVVTSPIIPTQYLNPPLEPAISPAEAALTDEISRLSREIEDLRNRPVPVIMQSPDGAPVPVGPAYIPPPPAPPAPATILIMRDGRQIETQSYAIAGPTLWIFGGPAAQRLVVADLDLAATQKENEKRGIKFLLPDP